MILITGATSLIGEALSYQLADSGSNLMLHARNKLKLDKLVGDLKELYSNIKIKVFIADFNVIDDLIKKLDKLDPSLKISHIVHNAGGALEDELVVNSSDEDIVQMINVNYVAPVLISKKLMKHSIHLNIDLTIIFVNSIASKKVYAKGAIYSASKAALSAFSEALNLELLSSNSRAMSLNLGRVKTNFWINRMKGDVLKHNAIFNKSQNHLDAKDVAGIIRYLIFLPTNIKIQNLDFSHNNF